MGEMKQTTDNELAVKCMNILMDAVGPVDAERFVSIVTNNSFDYTEWQRNLFKDMTIDEIAEAGRIAGLAACEAIHKQTSMESRSKTV